MGHFSTARTGALSAALDTRRSGRRRRRIGVDLYRLLPGPLSCSQHLQAVVGEKALLRTLDRCVALPGPLCLLAFSRELPFLSPRQPGFPALEGDVAAAPQQS